VSGVKLEVKIPGSHLFSNFVGAIITDRNQTGGEVGELKRLEGKEREKERRDKRWVGTVSIFILSYLPSRGS
jgi:hypothetical protein